MGRPRRGGSAGRRPAAASAAALARVACFAALPAAELARLAARSSARALRPGQVLFEVGQPCRGLFIVADGAVQVGQTSLRGREQVLHTEGPGAALGEAPLFDRGGYIASAVAIQPTCVLFLPRADVLDLCRRRPAVALAMLQTMARRVRRFAEIAGDLAFRPVPERLARYILAAAGAARTTAGAEMDLAATQALLAARLGTVRELVARGLAQLEASGAISRRGTRIVIRDPARLAALAGDDAPAPRDSV
jgi:CRP/FNR family transcriptional regulator